MLDLLKQLYQRRFKRLTIILLDDSKPGEDESFKLVPNRLFFFFGVTCVAVSMFVALLFMFTPLGSLLYSNKDDELRSRVEGITERVIALQDSLITRDNQLSEMKRVIRLSLDTTLVLDNRFSSLFDEEQNLEVPLTTFNNELSATELNTSGVFFSNIFERAPDFPTAYPVQGTLTRGFEPEESHYGIDIATSKNEPISALADGTIITANWTINDGYVIAVQHSGGLMSMYKHCSSITKKVGDAIIKGDILGTTGDVGVSSTGPHLHLEIWKNGFPQDPTIYLIQ
ncbi:MAG: M23 family metallopeptidase [Balneola sp.]|nr:MAG: M23 family metallopeptidase [Balneola sp.]